MEKGNRKSYMGCENGFHSEARWVLDGHRQGQPEGFTYAGVVSRESVRIALTYAALNKLGMIAGDIRNAYIQSPLSQKDFLVCGTEFMIENVGKKALIRRALYGGKADGRDFRKLLARLYAAFGLQIEFG